MTDVILFHHAHGLTAGVRDFGDRLRAAGHRVTIPDLYDGRTFDDLEEGVAYAEGLGFDRILDAGVAAAEHLPEHLVYAGFSLGALCAHRLAQTRPGALGAVLYHHGDVPLTTFGDTWPDGVDVQIHVHERDPWCDPDVVREFVRLAGEHARAELFLYSGSAHLFADPSLPDHDPASADLAMSRTLELLDRHR